MRVFLDTNVIVSAFATRGLCADVLRVVLAEHTLVTTEVVLEEVKRVLQSRIKLPGSLVDDICRFLEQYKAEPMPATASDLPVRDEADRWILASAITASCDVLVTGDRDLLDVAADAPVKIVGPRAFWEMLRRL